MFDRCVEAGCTCKKPATVPCASCGLVLYCSAPCSTAAAASSHTQEICAAATARLAKGKAKAEEVNVKAKAKTKGKATPEASLCMVCASPLPAAPPPPGARQLPCERHWSCADCSGGASELRPTDSLADCPRCRRGGALRGSEGLYDLGARAYKEVGGRVRRGDESWGALSGEAQQAVDHALLLLRAAALRGHVFANAYLGEIVGFGRGVERDADRALEHVRVAAEGGDPISQFSLGNALYSKKAYEEAYTFYERAHKQGVAKASTNVRTWVQGTATATATCDIDRRLATPYPYVHEPRLTHSDTSFALPTLVLYTIRIARSAPP